MRALRLDRAGLEFVTPDPALTSLGPDGRALVFHRDPVLTAASINALSAARRGALERVHAHDATHRGRDRASSISRRRRRSTTCRTRDWWRAARASAATRDRSAGSDLARLARWMPMSVADLAGGMVRDAICCGRRIAAHAIFGNSGRPAVGRHRRDAAAAARRRSDAGRQRRHGQGRPGRARPQALAAIATTAGARSCEPARASRASLIERRPRVRRRARQRRQRSKRARSSRRSIRRRALARSGRPRRSAADVPRARRSTFARAA